MDIDHCGSRLWTLLVDDAQLVDSRQLNLNLIKKGPPLLEGQ